MKNNFNVFDLLTLKDSTFYILETATVRQAVEKFSAHKFSVVPVIDKEGRFVSTISEGDILRFLTTHKNVSDEFMEKAKISEIERYRPYNSMKIDTVFDEIYALSLSQNFVPIVDDRGKYIGIIKRKDVFVYLKESLKKYFEIIIAKFKLPKR